MVTATVNGGRNQDPRRRRRPRPRTRTRVSNAVGDHTDRQAAARELAQVAARARDDRSAAFAWSDFITTLATKSGKLDEATALVPTASAAVLRAGDPPDLRANLLYSQAQALNAGPHPEPALGLLTQARQLLEQAGATSPSSPFAGRLADVVAETGMAYARRNEPDAAIASYRDAIERRRALYGRDSPDEATDWKAIGAVQQRNDKQDEALAAFRTAARIREARLGESPLTARTLVAVASALNEQRHWDEAARAVLPGPRARRDATRCRGRPRDGAGCARRDGL
jgi:tetratricopeptide (TPR) repeat protein